MNIDKFVAEHGCFRGQEIPGFREHVVPVAQEILKASRHLSATSLARNASYGGIDYRGCSKGTSAAAIARLLCGIPEYGFGGYENDRPARPADPESVAAKCRKLRLDSNGYSRQNGSCGRPAPIEADREHLVEAIAACGEKESAKRDLQEALDILGPPPSLSFVAVKVEAGPQFNGVLEALQQYVENGHDSIDDGDDGDSNAPLRAKLDAVQAVIDRLEVVLAASAD